MTEEPRLELSYGIPHGYLEIEINPSVEQATDLLEQVTAVPDELRASVNSMLRFYVDIATLLDSQNVRGCAIGLHPDDRGGVAFSVLTVSTVAVSEARPEVVIAHLGGLAGERPGEVKHPVELPCGTGFFTETKRRTTAPVKPSGSEDGPVQGAVWQGTVAVAGPDPSSVTMLQLVTPAVELAEDYRNVLLGVAHTLTFADPVAEMQGSLAPGSVAEAIKNEFG